MSVQNIHINSGAKFGANEFHIDLYAVLVTHKAQNRYKLFHLLRLKQISLSSLFCLQQNFLLSGAAEV